MRTFLVVLAFFAFATTAHADLRDTALQVHGLELRRQLASATPATIDTLLSLYADSVVYEHPNAGAVIRGKDWMRQGMARFIGSIRNVRAEPPRITVGNSVAVIEGVTKMEIDDDGTWVQVERKGIKILEFDKAGKVRRILDYPW